MYLTKKRYNVYMNTICVKYRLYPSKSQETKINGMLETCREVYNSFLLDKKFRYETGLKNVSNYDQQRMLAVWKRQFDSNNKLIHPELKKVHCHTLQDVANRVDRTYQDFFKRVKNRKTPGYPRYKGVGQYNSLTYTENLSFTVNENSVKFSKIGEIKAIIHRLVNGDIRYCILSKDGGDWYACVYINVDSAELPESSDVVAIDMGLEKFAVLSNGEQISNPRFYRKSEKQLAKAQRKLAKCKRNKSKREAVSNAYKKVRNQRHNFIHQESRKLINRFGVVVVEDLNVSNMRDGSKKTGLNKSISDAGWSMFLTALKQKAERAVNRRVIEVNPAYTSQDCHKCGFRAKKKLSERWHLCPMCGASLDRDLNAALNILALGTQCLGENP